MILTRPSEPIERTRHLSVARERERRDRHSALSAMNGSVKQSIDRSINQSMHKHTLYQNPCSLVKIEAEKAKLE